MWNRPSDIRPTIYRGELFYFTSASSWEYIEDGALGVADGRIQAVGDFTTLRAAYPEAPLVDYRGFLLMPGFIDAHLHYVQSEIIGLYGKQLLDWLQLYTFPAEEAFRDAGHARRIARLFLQELFRNGTTACVAFASIHPQSVEALFDEASRYDMYMFKISGADRTYVIRMFNNCLLRTQQTAAAAVMAEIVKDNHLAAGISQRMKRTEIDAGAAAVAPIGLYRRNHDIDRFKTCPIHGQEQMAIGDFYITVNIGGMILNISKIYTDKGLASASFSTQYCYFHVLYFLFCVSKPRLGRTMRVRAFVCKVSFSSLKKDLPLYKKRQVR